MSHVNAIACGLPFCQNNEGDQTNLSIALRVGAFALGLIGMIVGAFAVTGTLEYYMGVSYGWSILAVSIVLTVVSLSIKCIKKPHKVENTYNNPEVLTSHLLSQREHNSQLMKQIEKQQKELNQYVVDQKSILKKTAEEQFRKLMEDQITNLNNLKKNRSAETQKVIEQSIESTIRQFIILNMNLGTLTADDVNSLLDHYIATYTGDEWSFLSNLKQ